MFTLDVRLAQYPSRRLFRVSVSYVIEEIISICLYTHHRQFPQYLLHS